MSVTNNGELWNDPQFGLTLRDYFAAKALAGMCADATFNPNKINDFGDVAYQIADAMIEARNK